jgi:hypothetical protein
VNRRFTTKKGVTNEWHYYISSRKLTAEELLKHSRLEWSVETMHWLLDVHFGEDFCRVEDENVQQTLNIVRKIALNSGNLRKPPFFRFCNTRTPHIYRTLFFAKEVFGGCQKQLSEKFPGIQIHVCARAYRNKPLTDEDKRNNKEISKTRSRIEHIFGYMTRFMAGITCRVHGIDRVKRDVTAKNMAYNMKRFVYIVG